MGDEWDKKVERTKIWKFLTVDGAKEALGKLGDSSTGLVGPQHWLCDRFWAHMCDYYEGVNAFSESQQMMRKRVEYQKRAYRSPADPETGLSGFLAWSLESQGDMFLR